MMNRGGFLLLFLFTLTLNAQTTLRLIGPEDTTGAWAEVIQRFEAAHPEIAIRYLPGPNSTDERQNMYIRSFLGDDPVEIVFMDVTWTAKLAAKGWLLPLDPWFGPKEKAPFLPPTVAAGEYNGHTYRVPLTANAGMLYYRKDLVPVPPATWEELEAACATRPETIECFVFQGMQYEGLTCDFLEFLWGAGGDVTTPEPAAESLTFLSRLLEKGYAPRAVLTYQEHHSLAAFASGNALFLRNWPYAWRILNGDDSPLKGKVGIVPMVYKQGHAPAATLGGWGLGIAAGAKNPEAAWKFIAYASSEEAQKILHLKRGEVPSRSALFFDPEITALSPHYPELHNVLLNARSRPVHPHYPRISDAVQKQVSAALAGNKTPEAAARAMTASVAAAMAGEEASYWQRLLRDADLGTTAANTAIFTLLSVPPEFVLGLLIALLLSLPFRGRKAARLAVLVPWALPTAVMALSWQWMFTTPFGIVGDLYVSLGLGERSPEWLATPWGAMLAAVAADVWKTTPFVVIILLSGLFSIPSTLKESVQMETASRWHQFWTVTWPLLLPYVRVVLVFRLLQAAGIFDLIWVLTKGGPADATRTVAIYIYDLAFRYDDLGYALFLTGLFLAVLTLLSLGIVRLTTLPYERSLR